MSPEIRINGVVIADVLDETGIYLARDLTPLYVDVDQINARGERQVVKIVGSSVEGVRLTGLTLEGKGSSANTKKGGDGKEPFVEVNLHDRPIRVTYSPRIPGTETLVMTPIGLMVGYNRGERRALHNPRWVKGHGQR